jgi:hypothetical protein
MRISSGNRPIVEVKVDDLKKKNDYLFFELFSIYTKHLIKDDSRENENASIISSS